jgi:YebC/PmpR family DNA-binding regulatory protein
MSGHSKWQTIRRKKEAEDIKRGKLFSKLSRAISVAVKTGGGNDPETNYKLRIAIDKAKEANMPKENIERAISKGSGEGEGLVETTYEGFGPEGIGVMVEVATDNRNRTSQEIKGIFERGGGNLAGPGAVSFNFQPRGLLLVKGGKKKEKLILDLIDLGVEDVDEENGLVEAYTSPSKLHGLKEEIEKKGYKVSSTEVVQKPKSLHPIEDKKKAEKLISFLESLEDHDDVQKVFANADISQDILEEVEEE